MYFFGGFTKASHQTRLRQRLRTVSFGESQHSEGLPVIRLGADAPVEPLDCFHIVIEDMRRGIKYAGHGREVSTEVRRQHFHSGLRESMADPPNSFGKVMGAAVRKIVSIHGRDDYVAQLHFRGHLGDVLGFKWIE